MKKATLIIAVVLTGTMAMGQRGAPDRAQHRGFKDLSAQQIATLKTKKMTLSLDLTDIQQTEVMKINISQAEERKAQMESRKKLRAENEKQTPSSERHYEFQNARLDKQLAHQAEMKAVLNAEQYQQWKRIYLRKHGEGKNQMRKEGRRR